MGCRLCVTDRLDIKWNLRVQSQGMALAQPQGPLDLHGGTWWLPLRMPDVWPTVSWRANT